MEDLNRDSFIIYRSYWEGIKRMDKDVQLELYNAIMEYGFTGNIPDMRDNAMGIFILMKPNIDISLMRYRNGRKGGNASATKKGVAKAKEEKPEGMTFDEEIVEMLTNKQWNEPVCMQFSITPDDLEHRLSDFTVHVKTTMDGPGHESIGDAHRHFLSWMRKKYPAQKPEEKPATPDYEYTGGFGGEDV